MHGLSLICGALLSIAVVLNAMATWCGRKFIRKAPLPPSQTTPPVTLLVPVCGLEGDDFTHFKAFANLQWPQYEVIFAVLDPADPAIAVLRQISSSAQCKVSIQIAGSATGANLKIRNLLNAWPLATHDWIVFCDADVVAEPDLLHGLMNPMLRELKEGELPVGLVHSLYRTTEDLTLAASWESIWINCDFWTQGLLGDRLKGTDFAFGATMAMHRQTLQEIGGLQAVADYLADDYQIGNRISRTGRRLVFNQQVVTLKSHQQNWGDTWRHLLRWSRTIRVCQPGGYAGSILTNVTLFAVVIPFIGGMSLLPWSGIALLFRLTFANQCRNWILGTTGWWSRWWLIPIKDLAQALLWALSFSNGPVFWRGKQYRLQSNGTLRLVN